ncbi:MAG: immunoglobulin domain-containing protein [Sphingobacteriales bacterium]|nr:immunoglobulin domain-containing protein [Sphingobacteriales bacterium]
MGTNSATYTTDNSLAAGSYNYDVIVTQSGSGCTNTATAVAANVVADPSITISGNAEVCVGGSVTLTANVSGGSGTVTTYQWRRNGSNVGTNSATYTTDNSLAAGTYNYDVIVTQSGSGCTNPATAVAANVVADPTLAAPNLTNSTICVGGSTIISTSVSGGTGTFNYQWQYSANGSSGWANVANGTPVGYTYTNATSTTLNIATTNSSPAATAYYRCLLSTNTPAGAGCDAISANAIFTLVADPVSPTSATKLPNATSVCEGASLSVSSPTGGSAGVGCSLEYRYTQDGGSTFSTPGGSIPTLTANLSGYDAIEVRYAGCAAGCETSAWQELARWTVIADPAISTTTQPSNPICAGGNGSFSVTATGGTDGSGATVRTHQWQYSADGSTGWANVTNGTPTGISYTGGTTANLTASTTNASTPGHLLLSRHCGSKRQRLCFGHFCGIVHDRQCRS